MKKTSPKNKTHSIEHLINLRQEILDIENTIIEARRDLHKYPELGFEVHRTAGIVSEKLNSLGIDVQTGIGKTGVVGTLKGKYDGRNLNSTSRSKKHSTN